MERSLGIDSPNGTDEPNSRLTLSCVALPRRLFPSGSQWKRGDSELRTSLPSRSQMVRSRWGYLRGYGRRLDPMAFRRHLVRARARETRHGLELPWHPGKWMLRTLCPLLDPWPQGCLSFGRCQNVALARRRIAGERSPFSPFP